MLEIEAKREWKLPKNVRQIGEPGGAGKIYVEDYVVTFLEKLSAEETSGKALLLGEARERESLPYLFIDGALKLEGFSLDSEGRTRVREQLEKYFSGKQVMGCFLSSGDAPFVMGPEVIEMFQREFPGENRVLAIRDGEERENLIYLLQKGEPVKQPGYSVYYEKNPGMQDYLVEYGQGISVEEEAPQRDAAIRHFRRIIREKNRVKGKGTETDAVSTEGTAAEDSGDAKALSTEKDKGARQEKKLPSPERMLLRPAGRLVYAAGGFLAVTVLALGATMVYNYDKMRDVEQRLATLTGNVDSQSQYLTEDNSAAEVMLHIEEQLDAQDLTESAGTETEEENADADAAAQISTETADTEGTVAGDAVSTAAAPAQDAAEDADLDAEATAAQGETQAQEAGAAVSVVRASYIVQSGDTLAAISEMYYGSVEKVEAICSLNGISDENTILPGQKILLP